jgi:hypothetical protein
MELLSYINFLLSPPGGTYPDAIKLKMSAYQGSLWSTLRSVSSVKKSFIGTMNHALVEAVINDLPLNFPLRVYP